MLVGASLIWRWASRRRQLPCPGWLSWTFENPLTETVAGEQFDRAWLVTVLGEIPDQPAAPPRGAL